MNYDDNKVAIVIPLYNDAPNIQRAVESAAAQVMPPGTLLEVLIVDDCSTDDGPAIARKLAETHPHVRFFQQDQNQGPSAARNRALAETDAAWFTPLDSDDLIRPDRVAGLLDYARSHDQDLVADNLLISEAATPEQVDRVLWPDKPAGPVEMTAAFFIDHSFEMPVPRSELGYLKPLINRRAVKRGPRPYIDALRFGEDFELYTRMMLDGAKATLIDPLGYYLIRRPASASHTQSGRDHERLARISQDMLQRAGLTGEERAALRRHVLYSQKEAAWWKMIDGVRTRSLPTVASAFGFSPAASLHVAGMLFQQAWKRLSGHQTA